MISPKHVFSNILIVALLFSFAFIQQVHAVEGVLIYKVVDPQGSNAGELMIDGKNQTLARVELEARAHPIRVHGITFNNTGSASSSDISEYALYIGSELLAGPVSAQGDVSFVFDSALTVSSHSTVILELRGHVVSGVGKSVSFEPVLASSIDARPLEGYDGVRVYKSEFSDSVVGDIIVTPATVGTVANSSTSSNDDVFEGESGRLTYFVQDPQGSDAVRLDIGSMTTFTRLNLFAKEEDVLIYGISFKNTGNAVEGVRDLGLYRDGVLISDQQIYSDSFVNFRFDPPLEVPLDGRIVLELRGEVFAGEGRTVGFDVTTYNGIDAMGKDSGDVVEVEASAANKDITPDRIAFDEVVNPFKDTSLNILEGASAYDLYQRGILRGYDDGSFQGKRFVNRAEALKMLLVTRDGGDFRYEGSSSFPDVPNTVWYMPYVMKAFDEGVIRGYPDGRFRASNTVTTAEFLKMMAVTFDLDLDLPYSYVDVPADAWFAPYAGLADRYKLFDPERIGALTPLDTLTRREISIAIYQFLQNR